MGLSLISSSQSVKVRDEAHARALLQEVGVLVADDLHDLHDLHQTAPLLAHLTLAG